MPNNPVLVIGGTRSTGLLAARLLVARGVAVRIMARDPEAALQRVGAGFDIIRGDVTMPQSLNAAFDGASDLIFTAGVRSGRFARQSVVKATEYVGVVNTIAAARAERFTGRFVYMTSIGVRRKSMFASALNLWKGNTLRWRQRAEEEIRASGLDYSIVRAAFLLNRAPRQKEIAVRQVESPLTFHEAIARADVAEALVEAVYHPCASRATFEVAWRRGARTASWTRLFDSLKPDHMPISL
jgi:uncharacterized protein YbjT (DUF2867 family)